VNLGPKQSAIVFDENGEISQIIVPQQADEELLLPSTTKVAAIFMASQTPEGQALLKAVYDWFEKQAPGKPS